MCYMFLPPCSPDYNPIELAFLGIKAFVRWSGVLLREDLTMDGDDTYVHLHLLEAAFSVMGMMIMGSIIIVDMYNVNGKFYFI